ncbi:hypothetical protein KKE26_03655 [bacterium]|nr:hypothetical protein [bacterium]
MSGIVGATPCGCPAVGDRTPLCLPFPYSRGQPQGVCPYGTNDKVCYHVWGRASEIFGRSKLWQ